MANITRNIVPAGLLLGLLAAPAFAQAPGDVLQNFTLNDPGYSTDVNITTDGSSVVNGYAGRYDGTLGSQDINVFCVDLNHDINFGQSYTADTSHNVTDAAGPQVGNYFNGGYASALNSGYYNPVQSGGPTNQQRADEIGYLVNTYDNATPASFNNGQDLTTNLTAVSLAIWDIANDGGDGMNSGNVQLVQGENDTATLDPLVNNLETQASAYENTQFLNVKWIQAPIASGGFQSFAYVAPVPEAGTMAIFGILLAGGALGLRAMKKKRATEAA